MRLVWALFIAAAAGFMVIASMRGAAKNVAAAYRNRDDEHLLEFYLINACMNVAMALATSAAYVAIMVTSDGAFE